MLLSAHHPQLQQRLLQSGDKVMARLRAGEFDTAAPPPLPTETATLSDGGALQASAPLPLIQAQALSQKGLTGAGQVVVVIDSGFEHPEAADRVAFYDTILGGSEQVDPRGHGTHVTSDVLKLAPEADIVNIRVVNEYGALMPSNLAAALNIVKDLSDQGQEVDVVNLSLASPFGNHHVEAAVKELWQRGITVVAAAGNAGPRPGSIGSPANSPYVISVGAARDRQQLCDFSGRGDAAQGQRGPDVVAPGEAIAGWAPSHSFHYQEAQQISEIRALEPAALVEYLKQKPQLLEPWKLKSGILYELSPEEVQATVRQALPGQAISPEGLLIGPGTSFASPMVAGALAALEQYQDLTPEESRQLLMDSAEPLPGYSREEQGAGLINLEEALQRLRAQ